MVCLAKKILSPGNIGWKTGKKEGTVIPVFVIHTGIEG
jgi:hypothetical protein